MINYHCSKLKSYSFEYRISKYLVLKLWSFQISFKYCVKDFSWYIFYFSNKKYEKIDLLIKLWYRWGRLKIIEQIKSNVIIDYEK